MNKDDEYVSPCGGRIITFVPVIIFVILMIVLLSLGSCGPAHYLKKAERALKKAEQLGADISADTLWKTMEVPVPYVHLDTTFVPIEGDTVFLEKDRLKIKYVDVKGPAMFIQGECESDTVKIEVPVKVYREIKAGMTTWEIIILCIAVAAVAVVVGMFIQGRRRR